MEAAFGLGLAFSIFDVLDDWGKRATRSLRESYSKSKIVAEGSDSDIWASVEEKIAKNCRECAKDYKIASFSIGIMNLFGLIFIGIFPHTTVNSFCIAFIIVIGIAPLFFLLFSYIQWQYNIRFASHKYVLDEIYNHK